jgi:signal transduction histidine kinase
MTAAEGEDYPLPADEDERLAELRSYDILDTATEDLYRNLVDLAAHVCDAPMAAVSLIDEHRQWFKAKRGLDYREAPRDEAFCAHAIPQPEELLEVPDTREDERFADNPVVVGEPGIRFYAGAPLTTEGGQALGTICILDEEPRRLDERQRRTLEALSDLVVTTLELRQQARSFQRTAGELARSDEVLEEFTSLVSHRLRNALVGIHGNLELVQLTAEGLDVDTERHLDDALEATGSMEATLDALVRYARVGRGELALQSFGLATLTADARRALDALVDAAQAEIAVPENVQLVVDPGLFQRALRELFDNAIRHGGSQARVELRGRETADGWRIAVADDGPGLPNGTDGELFDLFATGPQAREEGGEVGLGLALCRRVVDRHDGEIGFERGEAKGATVVIEVPEREPTAEPTDP